MSVTQELLDWLLPTKCALCGVSGSVICERCSLAFEINPRTVLRQRLAGFAACDYNTDAAALLHAFKEEHQTALVHFMAEPVVDSISRRFSSAELQNLVLVPVPSGKKSIRQRGFEPAYFLARQISKQLQKRAAIFVPVVKALWLERQVQDQAGLNLAQRQQNLHLAMRAIPSMGATALLLDDVVTTGATIAEAHRAMAAGGWQVAGFCSFAETLPKSLTRG